jgi:hypothetical protein
LFQYYELFQLDKSQARERIIRVFTNYRGRKNKAKESTAETDALKKAASSLFDLKSYSKGKSVFLKRHRDQVLARRDELIKSEGLIPVAAYQKASKQLWLEEENHEYWDSIAEGLSDDIFT